MYNNYYIYNKIKKICQNTFNLVPSRETKHALIYSSKLFYLFFNDFFPCGSKAHEKRIPPKLLNLDLKKLKYLLQGYFDGDGSTDSRELRVACDTVSTQLIENLYFVLSRYGIYFRKYTSTRKPGKPVQQFYIKNGKPIAHSLGFTPLPGLVMGTRSGDIDPAIIFYLEEKGKSLKKIEHILNNESGLKGLSGISNDLRDLIPKYKTNKRARIAIDVFVRRIVEYIGAYHGQKYQGVPDSYCGRKELHGQPNRYGLLFL